MQAKRTGKEIVAEIEERKLAQEELNRAEYALRESEAQFRQLVDMLPVAVYVCDVSGVINLYNRAAVELWGREPICGDTNQRFCGSFKLYRPDGTFLPHHQSPVANVLSTGIAIRNQEVVIERPDGSRITVIANTVPIRNGKGEIVGVINCVQDITERKQTEEALREREQRLERQQAVLLELAKSNISSYGDFKAALQKVTEASSRTIGVERVSIWLYNSNDSKISCIDLYEQSLDCHSEGIELSVDDAPSYFKAMEERDCIVAHDAQRDPSTRELSDSYLCSLGITSMLDAPIRLGGQTVGVVCHEHTGPIRQWSMEDQSFVRAIADIISLILEQWERKQAEDALKENLAQLSKKNRYETIVGAVTRSVHQSINLQEVLENAVEAMSKNIDGAENVCIFLVEGEEAVLKAYRGYPDWFVKRVRRLPYPKGLTWKTLIEGKPIYCSDVDRNTAIGPAGRELGTKSHLSMPIQYEGKAVGVLNINSLQKNAFSEEELKLLEIIAHQIEIAINNARQAEELRALAEDLNKRNRNLEVLNIITQVVHQSFDLEEIYRIALDKIIELDNVDIACIYLIDEAKRNEAVLQDHRGLPEDFIRKAGRIPYPKGVTWKVLSTGKVLNVRNAEQEPDLGPAGRELGFRGMLGIPIVIRGSITIGVIWLLSYKEHLFTKPEEDLFTSIGTQIGIAIAKATLYRELSKKNRYETIISTIAQSVHRSINLEEVLENAVEAMSKNIDRADLIAIYLVEGEEAVLKAHKGFSKNYIERAGRIPYPKGFTWKTIIEGKPRYCGDVDSDTAIGPAGREMQIKSYSAMPVRFEDKVVGMIGINSFRKNAFDEEELRLLEMVAQQIETAVVNAKHAEALRQSEERYRTLFNQSPVGVYIYDTQFRITQCNERFIEILQSSYDKVIGLDLLKVKDQGFTPAMKKALEGQITYHESFYEATTSSAKLWVSVSFAPLRDSSGNVIGGMAVVEDITERKQVEERLSEYAERLQILSHQLMEAQESERRQIAHELHDEIGQVLTAVRINLQTIQRLTKNRKLRSYINEGYAIIDNALDQIRNLSLNLRPSMLDDLGLVTTLRWYLDQQAKRAGLITHFIADPIQTRLHPDLEIVCFRIVQEALTNIVRYAQAQQVHVELWKDDTKLELVIRDDGVGFDIQAAREGAENGKSFGLLGMQERVRLVGGQIRIESAPMCGTTIHAYFPLTLPPHPERRSKRRSLS